MVGPLTLSLSAWKPRDRMAILFSVPKNLPPFSLNGSFQMYTHTHTHRASDSLMTLMCILTKEVIENEEDTDVGREKTLKAHRQRRKKQVESTALLVHSPPAPTGATRPSLGESGACGWSRWSTLCGTQDTHNRTLVSMGSFFL